VGNTPSFIADATTTLYLALLTLNPQVRFKQNVASNCFDFRESE
jgi:hypothetical protein